MLTNVTLNSYDHTIFKNLQMILTRDLQILKHYILLNGSLL